MNTLSTNTRCRTAAPFVLQYYEICQQAVLENPWAFFVLQYYEICQQVVLEKVGERCVLQYYEMCQQVVLAKSASVLCFNILGIVSKWYWKNRRALCASIL